MEHVFQKSDFSQDQLMLLKMAFRLVDDVVETLRADNYDVYLSNELFDLKEKLGIYDLVE